MAAPETLTGELQIAPYAPHQAAAWDAFVDRSPNGLMLFRRGYMDYHADRFTDASLWVEADGRPLAVLPACRAGERAISSHSGLTFGGLVLAPEARIADVVDVVAALRDHARARGLESVTYKQVPAFLCDPPASPDTYALHRAGAQVLRVEPNFVVDLAVRPAVQERRRRSARRAEKAGVEVRASDDLRGFWRDVLEPVLAERHDARPVHDADEIELLRGRCPEDIALRAAFLDGAMVAGTVLYRYRHVVHAQYIAAAPAGRDSGALDLLFLTLLEELAPPVRFLSFGIASEEGGAILNGGLAAWKEGFGARSLPHLVYELLP